jgi:BirA family transcriptional regulator, biotin operon repressor / biotin---[acetyl-CoA-carboxylase] ligase
MAAPLDAHALDALQRDLPTHVVGQTIRHYASVESTNDLAKQQARAGHAEGLVLLAEEQTVGRGRMGRSWAAPIGSSLLVSLLLRPAWLPPADAFSLTMLAGVALCEAIEQTTPVRAALKWPNDLLLPATSSTTAEPQYLRKAAGILSELELESDQIVWVTIGMGININWTPSGVIDGRDLASVATSVSAAAGQPINRLELLRALLLRLDARYLALRQGRREELFTSWRDRLATLGQSISVRLIHSTLQGVAEDVELSGALRVRDAQGKLHVVMTGDVGG